MTILIGCVLTVAIVLLLSVVIAPSRAGAPGALRAGSYALLIGLPSIAVQTDLWLIAFMSSGSITMYEMTLASVRRG
jgi:hypothetical protein